MFRSGVRNDVCMERRALTIQQPWAALIVAGIKDVENRSWPTSYRGPLLIHAGLVVDREGLRAHADDLHSLNLVRGAVIGTVQLVDVVRDSPSRWAITGDYHWVLRDAQPLGPVPMHGRLGLWHVDATR